jgi:TIR domain
VGDVMGYLSNFGEDGFISYAHNDDDVYGPETLGWVTRLRQDLNQRVRTRLGANIQLWRDSEIRNHDVFSNKIFNRLIKTATFISVLSPSFLNSEWCLREVEAFARNADNDNGVLIAPAYDGRDARRNSERASFRNHLHCRGISAARAVISDAVRGSRARSRFGDRYFP